VCCVNTTSLLFLLVFVSSRDALLVVGGGLLRMRVALCLDQRSRTHSTPLPHTCRRPLYIYIFAQHAKRLYPLQISPKVAVEWAFAAADGESWTSVDKSVLGNAPDGIEKMIGFEGKPDPSTGFYCVSLPYERRIPIVPTVFYFMAAAHIRDFLCSLEYYCYGTGLQRRSSRQ